MIPPVHNRKEAYEVVSNLLWRNGLGKFTRHEANHEAERIVDDLFPHVAEQLNTDAVMKKRTNYEAQIESLKVALKQAEERLRAVEEAATMLQALCHSRLEPGQVMVVERYELTSGGPIFITRTTVPHD